MEILDYKTGKPKEKADKEDQLQLRLYALAVRDAFGLEPRRISFYYLRTNEKLSYDQDPGELRDVQEELERRVEKILSGDFTATPSPRVCRTCDFRRLCPSSKA